MLWHSWRSMTVRCVITIWVAEISLRLGAMLLIRHWRSHLCVASGGRRRLMSQHRRLLPHLSHLNVIVNILLLKYSLLARSVPARHCGQRVLVNPVFADVEMRKLRLLVAMRGVRWLVALIWCWVEGGRICCTLGTSSAAGAERETATETTEAGKDRNDKSTANNYANNRRPFAVGLCHTGIPAAQSLFGMSGEVARTLTG